jgi:myosin heavy subunit
MNFSKQPDDRNFEPSGHFRTSFDRHVGIQNGVSRIHAIGGEESSYKQQESEIVPSIAKNSVDSYLVTPSVYGIDLEKRNSPIQQRSERSHRFERNFDLKSSFSRNKRDEPERETNVFFNKEKEIYKSDKSYTNSSILGMELFISPTSKLERSNANKERWKPKQERNKCNGKSVQELTKELHKTTKVLECERSQRVALVQRLDYMDSQIKQLKKPRFQEDTARPYKELIVNLNKKIKTYISELEKANSKNEKLEEDFRMIKTHQSNQKYSMELQKQRTQNKMLRQEIQAIKETHNDKKYEYSLKLKEQRTKIEKLKKENETGHGKDKNQKYSVIPKEERSTIVQLKQEIQTLKAHTSKMVSPRDLEEQYEEKKKLQEAIENVKAQNNNLNHQMDLLTKEERSKNIQLQQEIQALKAHKNKAICSKELEELRQKNKKLQEVIENVESQNNSLNNQMRLLMFQHIPLVSSKLKDIGSVDYDIIEAYNQVSDYQLGKVLGEGYYGVVQLGTNIISKEKCAIKILKKEKMTRFKNLQQMALEVHVLKNYSHPNIIHLQDVIHAADNIYLVMELCSMDLHTYHTTIGSSKEAAKQASFGILKALEHLHSKSICHLDLKPENVLLSQSADLNNLNYKHIRLCDFGLVNMVKKPGRNGDIIRKGYACGTPGFYAPEMILRKEFEGRSADMWSLGAIILEITLGFTQQWIESYSKVDSDTKAFHKGLQACLDEISRERFPDHQDLLDIIHSCLSINPAHRITSSQAVSHPWLDVDILDVDEDCQDSRACCDLLQPQFPDLL